LFHDFACQKLSKSTDVHGVIPEVRVAQFLRHNVYFIAKQAAVLCMQQYATDLLFPQLSGTCKRSNPSPSHSRIHTLCPPDSLPWLVSAMHRTAKNVIHYL